ncbi:MAG: hypothetical protein JWM68_3147 [Verrucomicrobiales bacterium]|nr:hypothetical protein [Verrucomicrobiales bacterium]
MLLLSALVTTAEPVSGPKPQSVLFRNGDAVLYGCIYKPTGTGPFPAVVFNQSATRPSYEKIDWPPFLSLAQFFTAHGYAFFLPGRYAHEGLQNKSASTNKSLPKWAGETEARNADVLAGVTWLKGQSYIDENRIVLCGHSAGAIQALLVAAKDPEIRGTITFSVGAISWKGSTVLQELLQTAVRENTAPVLLLQPQNDVNIEPSRVLGDLLCKKPHPNRVKIFPPFGKTPTEANLFGLNGCDVWGKDVLEFLDAVTK